MRKGVLLSFYHFYFIHLRGCSQITQYARCDCGRLPSGEIASQIAIIIWLRYVLRPQSLQACINTLSYNTRYKTTYSQ
jgi:hypothetical protein